LYIGILEAKIKDFPPIVSFLKINRADALKVGGDFWGFFGKN